MRDYGEFDFTHQAKTHRVYFKGKGPGVLVMHELPGMVEQCVDLADHLVGRDFTVFLPLMFGKPDKKPSKATTAVLFSRICLSREFRCFAKNESSPITRWLRALCQEEIHPRCGGPGIGAIGMCLSGGFVLSLFIPQLMLAPVVSQPGLPAVAISRDRKAALGVSPTDLGEAMNSSIPLLGFRFQGDRWCPAERFGSLRQKFGQQFESHEIRGKKHSVLTIHFENDPAHPTYQARERLVEFLKQQLIPS